MTFDKKNIYKFVKQFNLTLKLIKKINFKMCNNLYLEAHLLLYSFQNKKL